MNLIHPYLSADQAWAVLQCIEEHADWSKDEQELLDKAANVLRHNLYKIGMNEMEALCRTTQ